MTAPLLLHRADGAPISTVFRKAAFGANDPFAAQREIAWEGPGAMAAGRVRFTAGIDVASFPHVETLVVVDGELTLTATGAPPLVLGPQAGVVIAPGTAVRIEAETGAHFVFCAVAGGTTARPGLTPLRDEADFKPSTPPAADVLLGPTPACRSDNAFKDDETQVSIGTWDSTPYHRIVRPHRLNEFMYLLAGSVRFASPDGSALTAGAGDALFVPQGAPIGWESHDRVAKFYVVQSVRA